MFDNYNDEVKLRSPTGKFDSMRHPVYDEERKVKLRYIKSSNTFDVSSQSVSTELSITYHSPVEITLESLIDGKLKVFECRPIRGIEGQIRFYKVRCR